MRLNRNQCTRSSLGAQPASRRAAPLGRLALLAFLVGGGMPLSADTLFQASARGKTMVVPREAIVVKQA